MAYRIGSHIVGGMRSGGVEETLERGLGLERTKGGADDKEHAYLVRRSNLSRVGICLITTAVVCLIVGLTLKSDLVRAESAVTQERQRVVAHKKALLVTDALDRMDNAQQEAKLIKVLSLIQAHFARDRKESEMIVAFRQRFTEAMVRHKKAIDTVLQELEGNPKIVSFLRAELYKTAQDFHLKAATIAKRYGAAIQTEGAESEQRLHALTSAILSELDADVAEEKAEKRAEQQLEEKDPEWKKLADQYRVQRAKEAGGAAESAGSEAEGKKSQDQKDVTSMISRLELHVKNLGNGALNALDPSVIAKAEADLKRFKKGGRPKAVGGKADSFGDMKETVDNFFLAAGVHPPSAAEEGELLVRFEELLEKERFITNGRPIMLDRLTQWEDSKISNAEMMAEIEKLIQKKQIDPRWLHDGNAVAESNFIKLDPSDHADHAAAAVPDPCAGIKDCVVAPPAGAAAQSEAHREP